MQNVGEFVFSKRTYGYAPSTMEQPVNVNRIN